MRPDPNTLENDAHPATTEAFFKAWCPNPSGKNWSTQLGVHFEEVAEMIENLRHNDPKSEFILSLALQSMKAIAEYMKTEGAGKVYIATEDREEFLDGLCDQMVTAIGVAHMSQMDIVGAFGEVNRSNNSKFGDNGQPILDENLKMVKGPNYFKPNLKPYT